MEGAPDLPDPFFSFFPATFSPPNTLTIECDMMFFAHYRDRSLFGVNMTEKIENLILEHLRHIRSDIASLSGKVDTLTMRVGSLEEHTAGMRRDLALIHGDMVIMSQRLDQHERRLERIEKRLELTD